jgi:NTP pyrophosphatase (non-canonical NTP hydrolase)
MAEKELIDLLDRYGIDKGALWKARIDVVAAMEFALQRHGEPTSDPNRGMTTIAEEVGEAAECALEATRPDRVVDYPDNQQLRLMCDELAQLAGYTMLLMLTMRRLYKKIEAEAGGEG